MNPLTPLQALFSGSSRTSDADTLKAAVLAWNKHADPDLTQPHFHTPYIVLGMTGKPAGEQSSDPPIQAISAIAVQGDGVSAEEVFYADIPDDPGARERVLRDFIQFVSDGILVSFRADFGLRGLNRLWADSGGAEATPRWLDLARLLPGLIPESQGQCTTLADWLAFFKLEDRREDAFADALLNCRLLMQVLARASEHGLVCAEDLIQQEKARRWLWAS